MSAVTDSAPGADAAAEVLRGGEALHEVGVWHLEEEESEVE